MKKAGFAACFFLYASGRRIKGFRMPDFDRIVPDCRQQAGLLPIVTNRQTFPGGRVEVDNLRTRISGQSIAEQLRTVDCLGLSLPAIQAIDSPPSIRRFSGGKYGGTDQWNENSHRRAEGAWDENSHRRREE